MSVDGFHGVATWRAERCTGADGDTGGRAADTYDFEARLASRDGGGALRVSLDGTDLGRIDVPATDDYQTYETAALQDVTVPSSGEQVLRLDVEGGYFTINGVRFARLDPIPVDEYEYGEHTYGTHGYGE
jgi:hypothetical protein